MEPEAALPLAPVELPDELLPVLPLAVASVVASGDSFSKPETAVPELPPAAL
jgi:hypothetical protein